MKLPIKRYWTLLHTYLRPQRRRMIVLAVLLALKIASRLVNPQIVRAFLDQAMAGAPTPVLLREAGLFFAIAAAHPGAHGRQCLRRRDGRVDRDQRTAAGPAPALPGPGYDIPQSTQPRRAHRAHRYRCRRALELLLPFVLNVIGNGVLAIGILVAYLSDRAGSTV